MYILNPIFYTFDILNFSSVSECSMSLIQGRIAESGASLYSVEESVAGDTAEYLSKLGKITFQLVFTHKRDSVTRRRFF
jgi:hypothetical protein